MRVYLAGPIMGKTDAECKTWRQQVKARLPDCRDPMSRDYRGREAEDFKAIVEGDKADIDWCDAVLVYYESPSVGTSMEVLYAWERGKYVIVWNASGQPLSPWLTYHSYVVVSDLEQAILWCKHPLLG